MSKTKIIFSRVSKVVSALVLGLGLGLLGPIFLSNSALATTGQITSRSIKIDNSSGGATSVAYTIGFTMATSGASVGGVVVLFCNAASGPIPNTACTAPSGFDIKTTSALGTITGTGFTTFTKDTTGAGSGALANVFQVTNATPGTATGTPTVAIPVTVVVNPTANNTTFYARIEIFDTKADSNASTATSLTGVVDDGGVALSTGWTIQITATVQEQLTFCVSNASLANCSSPAQPLLTIGHGSPKIVDSTAVDSIAAYMYVIHNASGNVVIKMKQGDTSTYGYTLANGTAYFAPANSGGSSNPGAAQTAGTEFFGLSMTGCSSTCTPTAPYSGGAGYYGLDTTTSSANVIGSTGGFGSQVASITPTAGTAMTATFGASASTTTKAGIYNAYENMMATGTY
jgi:hypothetical protein